MDTRLIRKDSLLCPRGKTAGLTFTLTSPQKKKKTDTDFPWLHYFSVRINGFCISDMTRKIILELSD